MFGPDGIELDHEVLNEIYEDWNNQKNRGKITLQLPGDPDGGYHTKKRGRKTKKSKRGDTGPGNPSHKNPTIANNLELASTAQMIPQRAASVADGAEDGRVGAGNGQAEADNEQVAAGADNGQVEADNGHANEQAEADNGQIEAEADNGQVGANNGHANEQAGADNGQAEAGNGQVGAEANNGQAEADNEQAEADNEQAGADDEQASSQ